MHKPIAPGPGIPPLIKRNTLLLALSQSFIGAAAQLAYGIGPLMVIAVTGSASLAGLTVGLFGVSRFLVSYPTGKITDTYGRKPGIMFGQGLTMLGSIATGLAMLAQSAVGLVAGMVLFTMGVSAAQQLRVAAADMYPPRMRGLALGFIATGSLGGIALSPLVMGLAEIVGQRTGTESIGLPWLMLPLMIAGGVALVTWVRPDPKEIGQNLERYYPGYMPPPKVAGGRGEVQRPAAPETRANAAGDRFQLSRSGQHGDRDGAHLAGARPSRPFAHRDCVLSHVPRRRHVRLHHPARLGGGPDRPRVGDVSGRRHHVDRRAVRRPRRGLYRGDARYIPGRARLVGGQCRLHRA